MKHVARWSAVVLLVSVSLLGGPPVASAAPPGNDEASAAVVISQLPFTDSRDVSEATESPDDPLGCFGVDTVWYRYTPTETVQLALDTFGSTFDTHLSVWTGAPGAWQMVGFCADSDYDDVGASATTFTAVAGTEYLIEVATCCDYPDGGPPVAGGHLTLHAYVAPPPMDVTLTVDRRQTVDREGRVTLTGTIACNVTSTAVVAVELMTQRRGASSEPVAGQPHEVLDGCGPTPTTWSIQLSSATDEGFRPGRALATVNASSCGFFSCDGEGRTVKVQLRRR